VGRSGLLLSPAYDLDFAPRKQRGRVQRGPYASWVARTLPRAVRPLHRAAALPGGAGRQARGGIYATAMASSSIIQSGLGEAHDLYQLDVGLHPAAFERPTTGTAPKKAGISVVK